VPGQNPDTVTCAITKPRDSNMGQERNPMIVTGAETKPRYSAASAIAKQARVAASRIRPLDTL